LDEIPGIGPVKRKQLLKHFGSVKAIAKATAEELRTIKGLSEKDIETLIKFLNKS
jgi:excinuclease ABC subunit C